MHVQVVCVCVYSLGVPVFFGCLFTFEEAYNAFFSNISVRHNKHTIVKFSKLLFLARIKYAEQQQTFLFSKNITKRHTLACMYPICKARSGASTNELTKQ